MLDFEAREGRSLTHTLSPSWDSLSLLSKRRNQCRNNLFTWPEHTCHFPLKCFSLGMRKSFPVLRRTLKQALPVNLTSHSLFPHKMS